MLKFSVEKEIDLLIKQFKISELGWILFYIYLKNHLKTSNVKRGLFRACFIPLAYLVFNEIYLSLSSKILFKFVFDMGFAIRFEFHLSR